MSKLSPKDIKDGIDPPPIVKKLENDIKKLKSKNQELKLQIGADQSLLLDLKQIVQAFPPKHKIDVDVVNKSDIKTSTALLLSDWHIGEVIEADEIEGLNSYNLKIARDRVKKLVNKFCKWSIAQGSIDEVVIICAGDMISGDIHEELRVTNEWPVPVQIVESANLLADCVGEIARVFKTVRVEFIAADNHSRRSKKYQFKQAGLNSYNYLVGWIAQQQLDLHENVEFNLHTVIKALIEVRGYKYLCAHGHGLKSWMGIPYYAAEREVSREAKYRMNIESKKFHKIVIGHFHTPMYGPSYIMNGSLSGTTEFDHGCGRYSPPSQVAWLVHPKHGDYNFISFELS